MKALFEKSRILALIIALAILLSFAACSAAPEMNEDFEKAVEALEIGEYSEVIDLGNAYQIIIRNNLDMDYYNNNYNTVEAQWLAREFFYYVEDFAEDLEVTWKKKYKDIKVWEIK
jgi:parvulin-like peptidyl-prolyl isomerase